MEQQDCYGASMMNYAKRQMNCLFLTGNYLLYREDCKCETASLKKFACECYKLRSRLRKTLKCSMEMAQWEMKIPGVSLKRAYVDISQDLLELVVFA